MKRHFVATGYVVRDNKTLLIYHKKLKMWLAPGGHIDEDELPDEAAVREVFEETGLRVEIVSQRRTHLAEHGPVRYLHVPNHVQLEDIPGDPPHQHIDLIYYCLAKDGEALMCEKEIDSMRWYSLEELKTAEIAEEVRVSSIDAIRYVMQHTARNLK